MQVPLMTHASVTPRKDRDMCTTARKLRRGTIHGRKHVLRVRAVTQKIKALKTTMANMGVCEDVTEFVNQVVYLTRLKKVMGRV